MMIEYGDTTLGRNIAYLRKKYGISRTALANLTGIGYHQLKNWEAERCRPVIDYYELKRLCAIFDLAPSSLVHEDLSM